MATHHKSGRGPGVLGGPDGLIVELQEERLGLFVPKRPKFSSGFVNLAGRYFKPNRFVRLGGKQNILVVAVRTLNLLLVR